MISLAGLVTLDADAKRTAPTPRTFERLTLRGATRLMLMALLLHCGYASAQNGSQNHPKVQVQRDERGVAAITRALDAMGGLTVFSALKDTKTEASCTRVSNTKSDTHNVRWVTSGDYFRYDGGDADQRGMVNGPHGSSRTINGKTIAVSDRSLQAAKPFYLPGLLLFRALQHPENEIDMLENTTVDGVSAVHLRVADTKSVDDSLGQPEEEWFFDPQTGLPLRFTFVTPALNSLRMSVSTTVQYSGFKSVQGVAIPGTMLRWFEGGPKTTCTINSFSFNQRTEPSTFLPDGGGN